MTTWSNDQNKSTVQQMVQLMKMTQQSEFLQAVTPHESHSNGNVIVLSLSKLMADTFLLVWGTEIPIFGLETVLSLLIFQYLHLV